MNRKPYFFLIGALLLALVAGFLAYSYTSKSWPFTEEQKTTEPDTSSQAVEFPLPDNSGTIDTIAFDKEEFKTSGIELYFTGGDDPTRVGGKTLMRSKAMDEGKPLYNIDDNGARYMVDPKEGLPSPRKMTKSEIHELEEKLAHPTKYKDVTANGYQPYPEHDEKVKKLRLAIDQESFEMISFYQAKLRFVGTAFDNSEKPFTIKYVLRFDPSRNGWFVIGLDRDSLRQL